MKGCGLSHSGTVNGGTDVRGQDLRLIEDISDVLPV